MLHSDTREESSFRGQFDQGSLKRVLACAAGGFVRAGSKDLAAERHYITSGEAAREMRRRRLHCS